MSQHYFLFDWVKGGVSMSKRLRDAGVTKRFIALGVSAILNVLLVCFLIVACTYGNAFNGKYSLGLSSAVKSNYLVLVYSGGKVTDYYTIKNGVIQYSKDTGATYWVADDGGLLWLKADVAVKEIKDTDEYHRLRKEYNLDKIDKKNSSE